jgi:molybdate transport system regulatory protein
MKLSVKLFLENHDEYVLGPGRVELLRFVEELGSLRKAAQRVGMSYRWAWGRINDMEKALGVFLLAQDPESGGKAKTLTPEARELLAWYNAIEKEMKRVFAKASAKQPKCIKDSAHGPDQPAIPGIKYFN